MTMEEVANSFYTVAIAIVEYLVGCAIVCGIVWFVWLKPIFE